MQIFPDSWSHHTEGYLRSVSWKNAVLEGMWPWIPQKIECQANYDIDFDRYRFLVHAWSHNFHFGYVFPMDRDDLIGKEYTWSAELAKAIFWAFRNRETWPVPSNIILGEE